MNKQLQGIGALTLAALIYGMFPIFTRLAGAELPFYFQNSVRLFIAFFIFLIATLALKDWKKVRAEDWKWFLLRSTAVFMAFSSFTYTLQFLAIGTMLFTFYAGSTILGYIIGKFFFGEKLNIRKYVSLGLAVVGLLLIYSINFDPGELLYLCLAFFSGSCTAVWNIFSKKVSDQYSTSQLNLIDNAIAMVFAIGVSFVFREAWVIPTVSILWLVNLLFGLGIFATGVLMVYGFNRLEGQIGSLIMLSEVLFAIVLGFLFFKEAVTMTTFIGGSIILLAIVLPELNLLRLHIPIKKKT